MKKSVLKEGIILIFVLAIILVALGKSLNIFSPTFFLFHDSTQPVRIIEQAAAIRAGNFPPRILPDVSFGLGFPTPNFYAPSSYYLPTLLEMFHVPIVVNLKFTFLSILFCSFLGGYFFLLLYFKFHEALFGAAIYTSSLYLALDIFTRGNIAESTFIALLPWALWSIVRVSTHSGRGIFLACVTILHMILTVHNLFSFFFIPIGIVILLMQREKKRALYAFFFALLTSVYFYLPLITEAHLTYAKEIATGTNFNDHFLCIQQLFRSLDGMPHGGSIPGCNDPMIFKLGWPQIGVIFTGITGYFWVIITRKNHLNLQQRMLTTGILILLIGSVVMATNVSQAVWNALGSTLTLVQFPWRFLTFIPLCASWFAALSASFIPKKLAFATVILASSITLFMNAKYFQRSDITDNTFTQLFTSKTYIRNDAIYAYTELLPRSVDLATYRSYAPHENRLLPPVSTGAATIMRGFAQDVYVSPLRKTVELAPGAVVAVNIHTFPYWHIQQDGEKKQITSYIIDTIGRPVIANNSSSPQRISVYFKETPVEIAANAVSIIGIVSTILYSFFRYGTRRA